MTDKTRETLHKLFMLFSIVLFAVIFFLLVYNSWDNTDAEFSYRVEDGYAVIEGFSGNPTATLEIPAEIDGYSVVSIASRAFSGQTEMKSLSLPDTVKYIGEYSFWGCTSLKTVEFGESLEGVGAFAFAGCSYIRAVTFPASLREIGVSAFDGCSRLRSVNIPKSCENIEDDAFLGCVDLVLDCSENEYAREYAKDHAISTDFADSSDALYLKIVVIGAITIVFLVLVLIFSRITQKKKEKSKNISKTP